MTKRREIEMFNLSFLDILTGALGAILFLFIIVPKGGGKGPASKPELALTLDTIQNKYFGDLPDSLRHSASGDTLLSVVVQFGKMPSIVDCPEPKPCPKLPDITKMKRYIARLERDLARYKINESPITRRNRLRKKETSIANKVPKPLLASQYKGDLPNVPCKFSVEIKWNDIADNVDLFLCKEGHCVYGGRKRLKTVGYWDSGKSRSSIFGGDLRTTQEAVRQFDAIIPGQYTVYAQYKSASGEPKNSIVIRGLVYTHTKANGEKGESFTNILPFNKRERTKIGEIQLNEDGSFTFNHLKN